MGTITNTAHFLKMQARFELKRLAPSLRHSRDRGWCLAATRFAPPHAGTAAAAVLRIAVQERTCDCL